MQIGFAVPNGPATASYADLGKFVTEGERMGFDYATFSDHIVIPDVVEAEYPYSASGAFPERARNGHHEQLIEMAYVAGLTTTLRLATSVMVVPYRPVVPTAKMLATLDVLSNGRLILGVGSGWMKEEFDCLQVSFRPRGQLTDEYLDAFIELWTAERPSYKGDFVSIDGITVNPQPIQNPHPPIWVGGMSAPALRRAARVGDAWYPVIDDPKRPLDSLDRCRAAITKLGDMAEAAGRQREMVNLALRVTGTGDKVPAVAQDGGRRLFSGSAAAIADDLAELSNIGVRGADFRFDEEADLSSPNEVLDSMARFQQDILSRLRG